MAGNYTIKDWDKETPNADYFKELFRVVRIKLFGAQII
jgi:hypothetical protein